jgi:hypothetical protein
MADIRCLISVNLSELYPTVLEDFLTIEWNNYKKFACVVRDIGLPSRIKMSLSLSLKFQILFSFLINLIRFMMLLFALSDKPEIIVIR